MSLSTPPFDQAAHPLRRLPLAALFCSLACAVHAQGISSHDVTVWSEFARSESLSSPTLPVDEASFAALSHGGPWSSSDGQPFQRSGTKMAFEHARAGRWDALLATLKADNPEPDVRDRDGATLLTMAARRGQMEVVRELLRRGANADRRGLFGLTPLGAAALGGHDLVVQDLLRAKADPERWSSSGHAPLHLAAREGHVRVIRSLLAAHANPMAFAHDGRHPLDEAAQTGQFDAMAALLAAGVKADAPDQNGLNALHAAALARQFGAVDWLRQRGAAVPHTLTQVLLDRPADPLPTLP